MPPFFEQFPAEAPPSEPPPFTPPPPPSEPPPFEPPPFVYRQPKLDHVEDVERYGPGGYHPVDIGDVVNAGHRQYEVLRKLGSGGFSTVWLVRSCQEGSMSSLFALKILTADSDNDVDGVNELRILQHLNTVAGSGHPNVVTLHDSFDVSGPNGVHHCLVMPVLGPNLLDSRVSKALPGPVRHKVCQQLASAVLHLHDHGICHGDISPSNVVFKLPNLDSKSIDDLNSLLGPIKTEKLRLSGGLPRWLHAPNRVVDAPDFSGLDYASLTQIQIVDFGQAFFVGRPPTSLRIPIEFFPLELCFGSSPSTKSDVWSLACLLYMVHSECFMFPTFFRIFEALIGTVEGYIGPLPEHWKGRFDREMYGYREDGMLKSQEEPEYWMHHTSQPLSGKN
ncbi:kinase-like protein [Xylariaceae sp. FL0662B]|nr:kinase-like protein [Xylariaceae sp. FL0662B]